MPVRRHHEKSRNGCVQCKARKVKCDEIRPNCAGCTKRSARCSYQDASPTLIFVSENGGDSSPQPVAPTPPYGSAVNTQTSVSSPSSAALTLASYGSNPSLRPAAVSASAPGPEVSLPSPSLSNSLSTRAFSASELDNLRLLRHYSLHTYKIVAGSANQIQIWRDIVPDLAFEHDYLMHGLLMIAALHLALLEPSALPHRFSSKVPGEAIDSHYIPPPEPLSPFSNLNRLSASPAALALHHHTLAVGLFRSRVGKVSPTTIQPLFAFSCILAVYAFGYPQTSATPIDAVPAIIHSLTLLRGTSAIVRTGTPLIASSPLSPLLIPQPSDPDAPLAPPIQTSLDLLSTRNAAHYCGRTPEDKRLREAYAEAIEVLRYNFLLASEAPGQSFMAVPFAILIPDEAAQGMRNGEPMALCILAHHAVLIHWLSMHIWLKGWGRKVVEGVWEEVGEEWKAVLGWPMREVRS